MKVKKVEIPKDSLVNTFLPANYSDAFSCNFNTAKDITADDIQVAFWTKWPKWIERLFKIRNFIVKVVGLKGDSSNSEIIEDCIRNNKEYKEFSVICKSQNETLIKLSDKHLDAYMSVYLSVWDGYFKTSFFFTAKNCLAVGDLDIESRIKEEFAQVKATGKLLPLILDIRKKEQLSDLLKIIEYKKSLK
ncbi:MAG: DUF3788 family protein [Dysgonomonas sp.]